MTKDYRQTLDGVGIGYHPFLHRTILTRPDLFDFVELPLDTYLDEAQRDLLDPDLARVGAIVEARPCLWRGSSLSLGSAGAIDTAATEATTLRVAARTRATLLREDLAVRRVGAHDLGLAQPAPFTTAMAEMAGARCEALAARLPCRFAVGLSLDALSWADQATATTFVRRFAAATRRDLVLDLGATAAAADPEALAAILREVPCGRILQIALTETDEPVWPALDVVLEATGARSVLIRRARDLFPLDRIFAAAARARDALNRAAQAPPRQAPAAEGPDRIDEVGPDLAATARDQSAFAERCRATAGAPATAEIAAVQARAVWREKVAELHRTQQLARWAQRPATWRV